MKKFKDVDGYIGHAPQNIQVELKKLRAAIKQTVPNAEEKISYGMPYYGYKGRLIYFAYAKTHIGLYIPPPIIQDYKDDLQKYQTAVSTVRFPLGEPLPIPLIKKLVKARVAHNERNQ